MEYHDVLGTHLTSASKKITISLPDGLQRLQTIGSASSMVLGYWLIVEWS